MSEEIKVSVIIPVYNTEKYLRQCLDSVVNQTLKDIEIICVDDGSTDGSREILNEYQNKHAHIKVYSQANAGQSAARNHGLKFATGDYVYFLDSDDYIRDDALELLLKISKEKQLDILFFGADSFFETEELFEKHAAFLEYYHRKELAADVVSGKEMLHLFTENALFRCSVPLQFIRRKFLLNSNIRFPEGIVHEDELFSPLLLLVADRAFCISDIVYFRRVRANSTMTGDTLVKKFNGQFTVFAKLLGTYLEKDWDETADGEALLSRAKSLFSASRTTYKQLSAEDRKQLLASSGSGYKFLFQEINYNKWIEASEILKEIPAKPVEAVKITSSSVPEAEMKQALAVYEAREQALAQEIELLRSKVMQQKDEINGMVNSTTYRIGRVITWVPRKIRGLIWCYRDHGLSYTVGRIFEHLGLGFLVQKFKKKKAVIRTEPKAALPNPKSVLVSVIVPVYNAQEHLRQCIDSILAQTLPDFELICVDDGSTDSSVKMIKEYQKKDKRVKLVEQKNQYAGVARNNGMKIAQGKYWIFLDADDFFEPDLLESMYNAAEKDNADVCLCAADRYQTNTGVFEKAGWLLAARYLPKTRPFNRNDCIRHIFQISSPAPWTKMFKREFVQEKKLQFQNLQRSNDLYFTFSAIAMAQRITATEKELVHYRVGQTTNLQSKNNTTPMLFCQALFAVKERLVQEGIWDEVSASFSDMAMNTTVYNLKTLNDEPRRVVLKEFKNKYADEFEFLKHDRDFYSLKANYDYFVEAMLEV